MKWIIFSFITIISITSCSKKQVKRPLANIQLENFLLNDAHTTIGPDTAYYVIIEPNRCIACKSTYIQKLLKALCQHKVNLIATSDQVEEVKKFITNWTSIDIIQDFNKNKLNGFIFLKNGLALAITSNRQVQSVEIIDEKAMNKYQ